VFAGKVICGVRNEASGQSRPSNTVATDAFYQTLTDLIISSLKAGVIPWEEPWKAPRFAGGPFPHKFCTGKPYRGIWSSEYISPFWPPFKQAQAVGRTNVRSRLKQLYGGESSLELTGGDGRGCEAIITIPLRSSH
jgi:hypothetical protein